MTLAIAWNSERRLHIASDSRITFPGKEMDSYIDVGVKVMALPVCISGTAGPNNSGPYPPIIFRGIYGFCYAGSMVNACSFKELVEDLLQNVQHIEGDKSFSFLTICEFLKRYCGAISTKVCEYLCENGRYEFFLLGYCPERKHLRGAKFSFAHDDGKAIASYDEILEKDGAVELLGSGAMAARERLKAISLRDVLLTLNEIIDDANVPSVGGDIQYGTFGGDANFKVQGIMRITHEVATVGGVATCPTRVNRYRYRGFGLYEGGWYAAQDNLFASPSFIELEVPSNFDSKQYFERQSKSAS